MRGQKFTLRSGKRTYTATLLESVTPEELLVWMSKAHMFEVLTGEDSRMVALGREEKDQMIKMNVTGKMG